MSVSPRILHAKNTLLADYQQFLPGDIIVGKLPLRPGEESLLVDLLSQGIRFVPAATAQLASRSKTMQARLFAPWMIPETAAAYDLQQLLELTNRYSSLDITGVIVKLEGKNAGTGVLKYRDIEDVYAQAATGMLAFPFVVQPFLAGSADIRVLVIGEYLEAYRRCNPGNFRNNLHWGGTSEAIQLSGKDRTLCREVMDRGRFPYGHVDLLQSGDGDTYLSEINLRGGIRGARISQQEYRQRIEAVEKSLLADLSEKPWK